MFLNVLNMFLARYEVERIPVALLKRAYTTPSRQSLGHTPQQAIHAQSYSLRGHRAVPSRSYTTINQHMHMNGKNPLSIKHRARFSPTRRLFTIDRDGKPPQRSDTESESDFSNLQYLTFIVVGIVALAYMRETRERSQCERYHREQLARECELCQQTKCPSCLSESEDQAE